MSRTVILVGALAAITALSSAGAQASVPRNSVGSGEVVNNSLRGVDIKERTLGLVPRARNARKLGGLTARSFQRRVADECPEGEAIFALDADGSVRCLPVAHQHEHDDRYHTQSALATAGSAAVHWGNLFGVPSGFADGVDDEGADAWKLGGNADTTLAQFLGTLGPEPLILKTDGVEHLRLAANGNVGIGTPAPAATLEVDGTALFGGTTTFGGAALFEDSVVVGSGLGPFVELEDDSLLAELDLDIVTGGDLGLRPMSDRIVLEGTTLQRVGTHLIIDLQNSGGSALFVQNGTSGVANLNVEGALFLSGPAVLGQGSSPIVKHLSAQATLDFSSIAAQTCANLSVAVTGASTGDVVAVGPPSTLPAHVSVTGYVLSTDSVRVRLCNVSTASVDPASASYRVDVWKH